MSYQVTDINGITSLRPNHKKMTEIVDEMHLEEQDEIFNDVILTHSSGCSISLYPNGCAVLEDENGRELTITELNKDDQLMLWLQLAAGNIQAIKNLNWS